jgi:hypothetical protein
MLLHPLAILVGVRQHRYYEIVVLVNKVVAAHTEAKNIL